MVKPTLYRQEMINEYQAKGYWSSENYNDIWDRNALEYPHKEAITDSDTRLTWLQAKELRNNLRLCLIELGIERDQIIVVQLPNLVEFFLIRLGCENAGIITVPVPRTLRQREMEYILKELHAVGVVIPGVYRGFDYLNMIDQIRPNLPYLKYLFIVENVSLKELPQGSISLRELQYRQPQQTYPVDYLQHRQFSAMEVSSIFLTTGSTGFRKFVEWPACTQMSVGRVLMERLRLSANDVYGAICPVTGASGLNAYYAAPLVAAKIALLEAYDAEEALKFIETEGVTVAALVPAQLTTMLRHPNFAKYDLSSLRVCYCTGALLTPKLAEEAEEKFGCPIVNQYGSIEGSISISSVDDPPDLRHLTVGRPNPGCQVRLVDDNGHEVAEGGSGEIFVRGPTIKSGYYKNHQMTFRTWTRDGWLRTGDIGQLDKEGNIQIIGRKKEIIIRGGQNIYPGEIEGLLLDHPSILNVAIVGMPDPIMGEKACAYAVFKPGSVLSFEDMINFLREKKVANFKLPERLEVIDEIPMVSGQKVDKKALEADIRKKLAKEAMT